MRTELRGDLPPLPNRMKHLPIGLPALSKVAEAEGNGAEAELAACVTRTMLLLPA